MTHLRKLVVVMSFALASTFITAAPAQAYTSYPNYTNRATYAARVTYDLNVIRSQHGLDQFTPTYCPLWFATKWAYHLAATGTLNHQSMYTILSACHATVAAENLGRVNVGPDVMVAAWMASPAHRANILDGRLTRIGVGEFYANGQWVVVTDFTRS